MSAELLGAAFKADISPHAFKLVMLKLVDCARDDGTKIYPSVATIAKAAGVSERHTKRVLHGFVGVGLLNITESGGKGRGDTTEYSMDVAMLVALGTSLSMTFENGKGTLARKGDTAAPIEKRVTPETLKGDARVTQPLKRTLKEDSRESARARDGSEASPETTARNQGTFDALAAAWKRGAIGEAGAIGDSEKAMAAINGLDPAEHPVAIDAAPRFLRSIKDAKRSFTMSIASYVRGRQFVHHPPPAKADPRDAAPVDLKPFTRPLWLMMWRLLNRARAAPANEHIRRRLLDALGWIERGAVIPAEQIPPAAESDVMVAVETVSPEFAAWQAFAARLGIKLPRPDHVPVIFVPATWPPKLTGGYALAVPVRIEVLGQAWWWRYWNRIGNGAPTTIIAGKRTIDPLDRARRYYGAGEEVRAGPLPLASELAELIEVRPLTPSFEAWTDWLDRHGSRSLWMWDRGPIWVPSEFPSVDFGRPQIDPVPDYDAIEQVGAQTNGEAA